MRKPASVTSFRPALIWELGGRFKRTRSRAIRFTCYNPQTMFPPASIGHSGRREAFLVAAEVTRRTAGANMSPPRYLGGYGFCFHGARAELNRRSQVCEILTDTGTRAAGNGLVEHQGIAPCTSAWK